MHTFFLWGVYIILSCFVWSICYKTYFPEIRECPEMRHLLKRKRHFYLIYFKIHTFQTLLFINLCIYLLIVGAVWNEAKSSKSSSLSAVEETNDEPVGGCEGATLDCGTVWPWAGLRFGMGASFNLAITSAVTGCPTCTEKLWSEINCTNYFTVCERT